MAPGNKRRKNPFALQKTLLRSVGISLDPTPSVFYRTYSTSVLSLMLTIPFVQVRTAIIHAPDLEMVAEILMYPLFTITVLIKVLVILKNKNELRGLLGTFARSPFVPNWERGDSLEERKVEECTLTANKLITICALGTAMVTAALPMSAFGMSMSSDDCENWQFAFGPILNLTCTPYVYPLFVYQFVVMSYFGFAYVFIFLLFIAVLMHLRCHLKILQRAVKRIRLSRSSLCEIVDYHAAILNLTQRLKTLFSPILLILFVADTVLIGYMMTLILECPSENVKCTRGVLCYVVLTTLLFVVSYWGNEITSESHRVAEACGHVDFVGADLHTQKDLVLIVKRSQKPFVFTAGGYVDLSLDAFAQILRASYSYFMLLYNAKNKQ